MRHFPWNQFNTNSELSQKLTAKQILSFKTTVKWLFNDIWCYIVIGCFDWKIGVFQQTVLRGLLYPSNKINLSWLQKRVRHAEYKLKLSYLNFVPVTWIFLHRIILVTKTFFKQFFRKLQALNIDLLVTLGIFQIYPLRMRRFSEIWCNLQLSGTYNADFKNLIGFGLAPYENIKTDLLFDNVWQCGQCILLARYSGQIHGGSSTL